MRRDDTIVAPATAPTPSGIGIVRLSGPRSEAIARALCPGLPKPARARHAYVAWVNNPANASPLDEAQVLLFCAPHSYTGEDSAEIQCHGSPRVLEGVLALAVGQGARPAEPGEFTRRAFENGRIDLARAEAVADLIAADSQAALVAATRQLAGELSTEVRSQRSALVDLAADLAAAVDFPDEADGSFPDLAERMKSAQGRLEGLGAGHAAARRWSKGCRVVFAGFHNCGKSSIFNVLCGEPRAIVDTSPGTTRDLLEAELELAGVAVTLVDTAGLGPASGPVEAEGVARARRAIAGADLVLHVLDATLPRPVDVPPARAIVVMNKVDLAPGSVPAELACAPEVRVSAKTGQGIGDLRSAVAATLAPEGPAPQVLVTSARHADAVAEALAAIGRARAHVEGDAIELAGVEVGRAVEALGSITGEDATSDVVDRVFARFCIGK